MNTKKLNYKNLFISILILISVAYIYSKFKINVDTNIKVEELNVIKKYLLNDETDDAIIKLSANKKPVLWLHIDYAKIAENGNHLAHEIQ